jgi:hypothetical protein
MDKATRYSAVPVGQTFRYKETLYTKTSCGRAMYYYDSKPAFIRVKKHEIVEWVNAWPNNVEA